MNKSEEKIYELLKSNELYRDKKGVYTVFPQKLLIEKSGKGESTVRRILKSLEEQGYIHRERIAEENVMLFYLLKEDFAGRHIYDRWENEPSSTVSGEKMSPPPQIVAENEHPSTDGLKESYANYTEIAQSEFSFADNSGQFAQVIENLKSTVKNSILQNSPVNNEMIRNSNMNDLYPAYISGKSQRLPTVVREKHGKAEQVISYVSFSYDDTADLEIFNKKGRFNITAYDRRVYNAVSTLFINGRTTISLLEIFNVMTGYAKKKSVNEPDGNS